MKRIFLILAFSLIFGYLSLAQITTSQSITFAVDNVKEPELALSVLAPINGDILAKRLNLKSDKLIDLDTNKWEPKILVNSFSDETGLLELGEDTVFQMLVKAWSQHRPVALSPDVIWMLICQQLSHHINQNPEKYKSLFVSHEGKKEICIQSSTDLYSEDVDWAGIIDGFASTLSLNTTEGVTNSLIANFSTTGVNERLASEITLMDVAKPFFEYKVFYVACGIPYITITGTPEDWKSIIEKARILESIELGWWFKELKPILEQFVMASEGKQDIKFWKNIVKKLDQEQFMERSVGEIHTNQQNLMAGSLSYSHLIIKDELQTRLRFYIQCPEKRLLYHSITKLFLLKEPPLEKHL